MRVDGMIGGGAGLAHEATAASRPFQTADHLQGEGGALDVVGTGGDEQEAARSRSSLFLCLLPLAVSI